MPAERPNVVLIMADDLGYSDLGCYGHPAIKTPVIDKLAKQGIRLTSFYAGATVCTPSRMALLTACYPARLGWDQGVIGHLMKSGRGLNPDAVTIAEIFKNHGYRTAMAGKWHLGEGDHLLPHSQGFEKSLYITRSNNQTDSLWRSGKLVEKPFVNSLLSDTFTREAIRFIEGSAAAPFFLYVSLTAPHFPLEAHPDWKGKSTFGVYGDVVEEMDHRIGEILQSLNHNDLTENTIVVFLSDNGPEPMTKESKAIPFRGRKWDALEGGTRVPCIVRWPGKIPQATESDEIISAMDLLPTLCQAAGIDLHSDKKLFPVSIDGIDVLATLTGKADQAHPRESLLFWHGTEGAQAIRKGKWKMFFDAHAARIPQTDSPPGAPALFDLQSDPEELHDVHSENEAVVHSMKKLAEDQLKEIYGNRLPLGEY